jgi:[acyl-carrier-protein] S-malonyltransferase
LRLVAARANAMQKACEIQPSTMAAILGLDDFTVEDICQQLTDVVVPANYNCPGQLVISGTIAGVDAACEKMTAAGAKRALKLNVGGAFHSPLMEAARVELEDAILKTEFKNPICPVYQNIDAKPYTDIEHIKHNLIAQLTGPVRWTQTVMHMLDDSATSFTEVGPGKVLQGLVKKVNRDVATSSAVIQ